MTKFRECMHEDGYEAFPGKRKCKWHLLLKMPIEDQIMAAEQRRGAADYVIRGIDEDYPRARVPSKDWPAGERWCAGCQAFVPLFYCTGSRCKAHNAAAGHTARLSKLYGIDRDDYKALLELQGGVCAICGQTPRTKRLAVDHDHKTGEVRGLLCPDNERGCNHAVVGSLEARSVDGIVAAAYRLIDYIENPPFRRLKETTSDQTSSGVPSGRGRDLAGGDPSPKGADRDVAGGAATLPEQPARRQEEGADLRGGQLGGGGEPDWVREQRSLRG